MLIEVPLFQKAFLALKNSSLHPWKTELWEVFFLQMHITLKMSAQLRCQETQIDYYTFWTLKDLAEIHLDNWT